MEIAPVVISAVVAVAVDELRAGDVMKAGQVLEDME